MERRESATDENFDTASTISEYAPSEPELEFDNCDCNDLECPNHPPYRRIGAPAEANKIAEILAKPKTNNYNFIKELRCRELGLDIDRNTTLNTVSSYGFMSRFNSSRLAVERMQLSHSLRGRTGHTSSLSFDRSGELLCSSYLNSRLILWDWAKSKRLVSLKLGREITHIKLNDSSGGLDILWIGGMIMGCTTLTPSGGRPYTRYLHKKNVIQAFDVNPRSPNEILSIDVDGAVNRFDLRENISQKLNIWMKFTLKMHMRCISHHPFQPQICCGGEDEFIRVFDTRYMPEPLHMMCPAHLIDETLIDQNSASTGKCTYNNTGSEIIVSYHNKDIYLFDTKVYQRGDYTHRYSGHTDHCLTAHIKFFGPHSEYVVANSDCGQMFFWDKQTEAIVNILGTAKAKDCLEIHPWLPVMATCGGGTKVNIWSPTNKHSPPNLNHLERRLQKRYFN